MRDVTWAIAEPASDRIAVGIAVAEARLLRSPTISDNGIGGSPGAFAAELLVTTTPETAPEEEADELALVIDDASSGLPGCEGCEGCEG